MESQKLISTIFTNENNLKFDKCVIKRVYEKKDSTQTPIIYTYFNLKDLGDLFYYLDKNTGKFVEASREKFEKIFECYEEDLVASNGKKPWELKEETHEKENLEASSGRILTDEGEER